MARIAIFGGGMTGLVAARELGNQGHEVDVYEAEDRVGGLAKTFTDDEGFTYDNGPRFIFSTLAEKIGIGEQCEPVKYWENLWVGGKYYLFPFGFIRNPKYCVSAGLATLTRSLHKTPTNLGRFLEVYYGKNFSREVLKPLISKWAGLPTEEMSVDFASRLLPTNIKYIVHSLVKKLRGGVTEDYYRKGRYIVYPKSSNRAIFDALSRSKNVSIHTGHSLNHIESAGNRILSARAGGREVHADYYLSTIPIHHLSRFLETPTWTDLEYRAIMILFLKINRRKVLEPLWTWFPETKYVFYRISEFKNALPALAPEDRTLISVEMACRADDSFARATAEEVFDTVRPDLQNLYGIRRDEIIGMDLKKSPYAYPILRKATEDLQRSLTHRTQFENLFIAGRTGMFQYRMLEGCYESAMTCVETMNRAIQGLPTPEAAHIAKDAFGRPLVIPE